MRRARTAAMLLVLTLLPVPALSRDEGLPDGAVCADAKPASEAEANALCQSGKCRPGPSVRARPPVWYCTAREMACALPGAEGAGADALITLDGTRYQCLDPGTGGHHRFAPIR